MGSFLTPKSQGRNSLPPTGLKNAKKMVLHLLSGGSAIFFPVHGSLRFNNWFSLRFIIIIKWNLRPTELPNLSPAITYDHMEQIYQRLKRLIVASIYIIFWFAPLLLSERSVYFL